MSLPANMASATPAKQSDSASSTRRLMNPPSNRLRSAVAGLRRVKRLWRGYVERVEDFFFMIGIWICVKRILEESRRCRPRFARGGMLWI